MKHSGIRNNNATQKSALKLCAEAGPFDGIKPCYLYREPGYLDKSVKLSRNQKDKQKSSRICNEVAKVLSMALMGEMSNPMLQGLQIVSVTAEGDGQYLCVSVGHYDTEFKVSESQVVAALKRVQGYLRSTITQRINRKRVPTLLFRYVGIIE